MAVTPEIHVARVEQDGDQLAMELYRGRGREAVTARLRGGTVHEVWIGDVPLSNERGSQERLSRRPDLIGTIARKAEEFALLLSRVPPTPAIIRVTEQQLAQPRRLGDILRGEPYPEDGDGDPYPELADAT